MLFSTAEEGSGSSLWWQNPSMLTLLQDFFRRGVSIRVSSDSRGIWLLSGSLFLWRGFVIWFWSGDFFGRQKSSRTMTSSYFLVIVSGRWGTSPLTPLPQEKGTSRVIRRLFIIVTLRHAISMTSVRDILQGCFGECVRFFLGLFLFLHGCMRKISRNLIAFSPILKTSKNASRILQDTIQKSSIHRRMLSVLRRKVIRKQSAVIRNELYIINRNTILKTDYWLLITIFLGLASHPRSVSISSSMLFSICLIRIWYFATGKTIPWKMRSSEKFMERKIL